jgi:hypothetical protein
MDSNQMERFVYTIVRRAGHTPDHESCFGEKSAAYQCSFVYDSSFLGPLGSLHSGLHPQSPWLVLSEHERAYVGYVCVHIRIHPRFMCVPLNRNCTATVVWLH